MEASNLLLLWGIDLLDRILVMIDIIALMVIMVGNGMIVHYVRHSGPSFWSPGMLHGGRVLTGVSKGGTFD